MTIRLCVGKRHITRMPRSPTAPRPELVSIAFCTEAGVASLHGRVILKYLYELYAVEKDA